MNLGSVRDDDHPPFAASRACETLFGQMTKGFRIAFLGTDSHDLARAPVCGGTFLSLGWTHARRPDLALLTAQHPHPRQGGKQAQLRFILNINIGSARRVVEQAG
jgi:hypothetical protein